MNSKSNITPSNSTAEDTTTSHAIERTLYSLAITPERLPPAYTLTRQHVLTLAVRLSSLHATKVHKVYLSQGKYKINTGFYGIVIESDTKSGATAKSACVRFWRNSLENKANLERLNFEAKHRLVGGPNSDNTEIYCSDSTVNRMREKTEASNKCLSKMTLKNTITGEELSMLDIAKASFSNRFNELYSFTKNFEAMAKDKKMDWIFVTLTAPPEFHPNPSSPNSKCSYNPELGVKASHTYINNAWQRIRAILNKRGINASPTTYFGARTVEVHKDGCIHWHLLIFINHALIHDFNKACKEKFPLTGQLKIVLGDDSKGSASSYVFKYIMKEFNTSNLNPAITARITEADLKKDIERERMDLASISNSERVRAAIQALRIRQYQTIGLLRVTTLLRKINKLDLSLVIDTDENILGFIRNHVWRNPLGLKNLLEKPKIFSEGENENPPIRLIKEGTHSRYGEERERIIGIDIDGEKFISKGLYKIIKTRQ